MRHHHAAFYFQATLFVALSYISTTSVGYEYAFSEFNNAEFGHTFGDFQQEPGDSSLRLFDIANGAGGAGIYLGEGIDFTDFADSRVKIDFTVNASNRARWFEFELYDVNSHAAKWRFDVQQLPADVKQHGASLATLANPDFVIRNVDHPGTFDLSKVRLMQIVGDYGSAVGSFDISFDRITVETDLAYPGAPDEAWYTEAERRIEANRKANLTVVVRDAEGHVVPGAKVHVAMQRHEFGFGSAIATSWINAEGADAEQYRQKLLELFNLTTTENALKWRAWSGAYGSANWSQDNTLAALDWLADHNLPVRGHNVIWPGERWLPQPILDMVEPTLQSGEPLDAEGQQALRAAIAAHIDDVVGQTAGKVVTWDVVNEPRANHLLMDALDEGNAAMVDWFNQVKSVLAAHDSSAKLVLNEYDIVITGGATDTKSQQTFFDQLRALQQAGAAIDGLGIQGHFREGNLTGPEDLWSIFDRFAALGLGMEITEFDFGTTNRELQARYLRDFFTAAFAHESIDNIVQWGFWAGAHFQPEAALFSKEWSIRPHGQAYVDLVFDQWWTDEQTSTNDQGEITVRGFKGQYKVTAEANGREVTAEVNLSEGGNTVELTLD
ncbi:endo-1,4-beta-xylanase [Aeoliella sp. ICT_H6.2]|uniref:Beta-xylanase n=1 Tax=Aeoliella straminimaris TaxID=2954799 RepID=A0A9X2JKD6_9BACT|nr:endo-1,4-beta-xylanase [Aeoliella straminimaris]MCO6048133.1 endo-1,4-beta-xylanase [Aeoliella straminimaris]